MSTSPEILLGICILITGNYTRGIHIISKVKARLALDKYFNLCRSRLVGPLSIAVTVQVYITYVWICSETQSTTPPNYPLQWGFSIQGQSTFFALTWCLWHEMPTTKNHLIRWANSLGFANFILPARVISVTVALGRLWNFQWGVQLSLLALTNHPHSILIDWQYQGILIYGRVRPRVIRKNFRDGFNAEGVWIFQPFNHIS